MLARTPWSPNKTKKPRWKLSRDFRRSLISSVAIILDKGEPTRFAFEAACRSGLRARYCLKGWPWAAADRVAADVVRAALKKIGAARPSWLDGQREITGHSWRFYCANPLCQKPLQTSNGKKLYCSVECRRSVKHSRWRQDHEKENAARAAVWRIAARKKGEYRNCHQCARQFQAHDRANTKPQRFCSNKCVAAYASTFAASWRRYPKKFPCGESANY